MSDETGYREDLLDKAIRYISSTKRTFPYKQIGLLEYFLCGKDKEEDPSKGNCQKISNHIEGINDDANEGRQDNKNKSGTSKFQPKGIPTSIDKLREKVNSKLYDDDYLWCRLYFEKQRKGGKARIRIVLDTKDIITLTKDSFNDWKRKRENKDRDEIRQKLYDSYPEQESAEDPAPIEQDQEQIETVQQDEIQGKIGKYIDTIISEYTSYYEDEYLPSEAIDKNNLNDINIERNPERIPELIKAINDDNGKCVSVIEGLQKYSNGHVLLIGEPCIGKTSALYKLLLIKSTEAKNDPKGKIPVFLSLKYFDSSVESLIRKAFYDFSKIKISEDDASRLISHGRLYYLFDGINETGEESYLETLKRFASENIDAPMVFTTRPYSKGGDIGIKQKLEMLPFGNRHISAFSRQAIPENYREFLFKLKERDRILSKTPYFFNMILSIFIKTKGELSSDTLVRSIEEYLEAYSEHLKTGIKVSDNEKSRWPTFSKYIAFFVLEESDGRDPLLNETTAVNLISAIRKSSEAKPETILNNLIDHYVIVRRADGKIGFCNKTITDYFAGKYLLGHLPTLSDAVIKNRFLNKPKWTDPILFMLKSNNDEKLKERIYRLATEIDKSLCDRLTNDDKFQSDRSVARNLLLKWNHDYRKSFASFRIRKRKPGFRKISPLDTYWAAVSTFIPDAILDIDSFNTLISFSLKTDIFVPLFIDQVLSIIGDIGNDEVAGRLKSLLPIASSKTICLAAKALGKIENKEPSEYLLDALTDNRQDEYKKKNIIGALALLKNTDAVPHLIELLSDDRASITTLHSSIKALGDIGDTQAVDPLLKLLLHKNPYLKMRAIEALGLLEDRKAIKPLSRLVENDNIEIRIKAVTALGRIRKNISIEAIEPFIGSKNIIVLSELADILGEIGTQKAAQHLVELLSIRPDNFFLANKIITALGKTRNSIAIDSLSQYLRAEDRNIQDFMIIMNTLSALVNIGDKEAIHLIQPLMKTKEDPLICLSAAEALFMLGEKIDDTFIISQLTYRNSSIFCYALYLLEKVGDENTISKISNLSHMSPYFSLGVKDTIFELQAKLGIYNPALQ